MSPISAVSFMSDTELFSAASDAAVRSWTLTYP
jgi:hypothetical protein